MARRCDTFPPISNGELVFPPGTTIKSKFVKLNYFLTFTCDKGYQAFGEFKCLGNNNWNEENQGRCIPVDCDDPGHVENGNRDKNLFTFPNVIEYTCKDGYTLFGNPRLECSHSGKWSSNPPTCEMVCKKPKEILNGSFSPMTNYYKPSDEILFQCDHSNMTVKSICNAVGKWSNEPPICPTLLEAQNDRAGANRKTQIVGKIRPNNYGNMAYLILFSLIAMLATICGVGIYKLQQTPAATNARKGYIVIENA